MATARQAPSHIELGCTQCGRGCHAATEAYFSAIPGQSGRLVGGNVGEQPGVAAWFLRECTWPDARIANAQAIKHDFDDVEPVADMWSADFPQVAMRDANDVFLLGAPDGSPGPGSADSTPCLHLYEA